MFLLFWPTSIIFFSILLEIIFHHYLLSQLEADKLLLSSINERAGAVEKNSNQLQINGFTECLVAAYVRAPLGLNVNKTIVSHNIARYLVNDIIVRHERS